MSLLRAIFAVSFLTVAALSIAGCGDQYIQDDEIYQNDPGFRIAEEAQIPDTTEARQALDVLARYRQAVVQKDFGALNRLISPDYYDNAGTTDTTKDDYDAERLSEVFEMMAEHTESISYEVMVKSVDLRKDRAFVDYEYEYSYQYKFGDDVKWDAGVEVNRLELVDKGNGYKIVSGL
ncbi:MAG: hypothetical protein ACQEVA_09075 [Myxococcota bacterium]